jgi:formylglycine-generating enzyme required for sulfatase activity
LTASISVTGTVDMNTTGTYILTYSVADAAGNEANASRTITVVDTTHPVLTLLGDVNMSQAKDSAWVDPGATASDSLDGNLTNSITITGTVDVNTTGVYTLTYSISDGASNEANATRVVNVGQASTHNADLNASVQLQMLWVEPGTFTMGSPTRETGRSTNETEHNVTLTKGFYLGKYEVTQAQYEAVMTGNTDSLSATPSEWPNNPNRPVEKVSWADAQIFLTRLNAQQSANIPAGWAYVLPTESQWEYACRAGTTTAYSWGATIASSNANYNWDGAYNTGVDFKQTRDVGQYAANPWGFFDMHGNVWEWTADWYGATYPTGNPVVDPTGEASGSNRVLRGGSWYSDGAYLRSARRHSNTPSNRNINFGFRVGFQQQ